MSEWFKIQNSNGRCHINSPMSSLMNCFSKKHLSALLTIAAFAASTGFILFLCIAIEKQQTQAYNIRIYSELPNPAPFKISPNTLSETSCMGQMTQHCQSIEERYGHKDQTSIPPGLPHHVTTIQHNMQKYSINTISVQCPHNTIFYSLVKNFILFSFSFLDQL